LAVAPEWGSITGDISNQADLQNSLNMLESGLTGQINQKQPLITATGSNYLLTAPAAAGGQPGKIAFYEVIPSGQMPDNTFDLQDYLQNHNVQSPNDFIPGFYSAPYKTLSSWGKGVKLFPPDYELMQSACIINVYATNDNYNVVELTYARAPVNVKWQWNGNIGDWVCIAGVPKNDNSIGMSISNTGLVEVNGSDYGYAYYVPSGRPYGVKIAVPVNCNVYGQYTTSGSEDECQLFDSNDITNSTGGRINLGAYGTPGQYLSGYDIAGHFDDSNRKLCNSDLSFSIASMFGERMGFILFGDGNGNASIHVTSVFGADEINFKGIIYFDFDV